MANMRSNKTFTKSQSRQEYRKSKKHTNKKVSFSAHARRQQRQKQKEERKKLRKPRRRIFPIWLRVITVLICCVAALAAGLVIGFGVIGDGEPSDALNIETWEHIIDFITKD